MKKFFLMMFLLATFVLSGCNTQAAGNQTKDDDLKISMLNIGHGDAILIRTKEQTILFDAANSTEHERFVKELEKFSVTKIDKLILTHPHVDHIGGAKLLINPSDDQLAKFPYLEKISVGEIYDNGIAFTSPVYINYMKSIEATGIHRQSLKAGDTLDFGGGVNFKILFPTAEYVAAMNSGKADNGDRIYKMNNSSLVGKLVYKNFSMMLTGDCEKESEATIVESYDAADLKCDVLKAGHHGSKSSSTVKFLRALDPKYVLISAGNKEKNGDANGSPHLRALEKYLAQGVDVKNIFCTRWNGSITVTTDGESFSVKPEVSADWVEEWMSKKRELGAN